MTYIVFKTHEDRAFVSIEAMSKENVEKEIKVNYEYKYYEIQEDFTELFDLDTTPLKMWIIKGNIVIPKPIEKVTKFELEEKLIEY